MRFDALDMISKSQALAAFGNGTAVASTNVKQKPVKQDIGIAKEMGMHFFIEAFTAGSATNLVLAIVGADNDALTTNPVTYASVTIPVASVTVGAIFFLELPAYVEGKKYIGVKYDTTGAVATSLTVSTMFGSKHDVVKYKSFNTPYEVKN